MDKYKSIIYTYNTRTKRYTIYMDKVQILKGIVEKSLGKSTTRLLILKDNDKQFDIYEFFLLELFYILEDLKDTRPDLVMDLGGILLNDLLTFLKVKTWLSERFSKRNIKQMLDLNNITKYMKFPPMEHQLLGYEKYEEVKFLSNLRGFMLDAEAGTGKTYMSLSLGEVLDYNFFIIIAPKATIDEVWVKSITESLYKTPQSYKILSGKDRDIKHEKFIIFHYEYISKILNDKKLMRRLKKLKPFLIVDEFHNFNEITTERTNNLLEFVNKVDFEDIALLTGTPIKMNQKELKPLLYILDKKFPPIADRFEEFYSRLNYKKIDLIRYRFGLYKERIYKDKKNMPDINIQEFKVSVEGGDEFTIENINKKMKEYKDTRLEEINDNMDTYISIFNNLLNIVVQNMLRASMKKGEINSIMKSYNSNVKVIKKHAKNKELYKIQDIISKTTVMEKEYILPYLNPSEKDEFKNIRSIVKYPELKVLGEALGKILLGSRIACYNSLASNINYKNLLSLTNKKGIVFSNYVSVCETVRKKCLLEDYSPAVVYGEHTKNLTSIVRDYNDLESKTNPIVATYKSLSTGVPLTSGNVIILIDTALRLYLLEQSIARAWRIGNDEAVVVFMVKLDTGKKFNITDRDLYIVNLSQYNVEMLTGVDSSLDIPKQTLESELDELEDETESEILEELEEEVEEEMMKTIRLDMKVELDIKDTESTFNTIKNLVKKFKFKL